MHFLIIGCGGVGGYLAYKLRKNDHDVSIVARGAHLEKIQEEGLRVGGIHDETLTLSGAFSLEDLSGDYDWTFFTTKVHQLQDVLDEIQPDHWTSRYVATFQNGLEAHEMVQEAFSKTSVFGGIAYIDAYLDTPGSIRVLSKGRFGIGHETEMNEEPLQTLRDVFQESDLSLKIFENLRQKQWEKMAWNLVFNPLSILTGKTVGEIKKDYSIHGLAEQLLEEAYALAKAEGIRLPKSLTEDVLSEQGAGSGNENSRTSMYADFTTGKNTEIDFINGALVRLGKKYGTPTPANESVVAIIHDLENKREKDRGDTT